MAAFDLIATSDWSVLDPRLTNWTEVTLDVIRVAIAFALAVPIGWEREHATRMMGLRTFPLVAVASCGYVLIGTEIGIDSPEAQARIIEGLMTGIGFIGGGAILKSGGIVRGTSTAACIWCTGAIGGAVAYDRYGIAIIVSAACLLTLQLLRPLKAEADPTKRKTSDPEVDDD